MGAPFASTYAHGVHAPVVASPYARTHVATPLVHSVAAPVVSHVATPAVYSGVHSGVYSGIHSGVYNGLSSVYGNHYYGKREAEPYTIGQVYGGLPVANAYATGHAHNLGYATNVGYSHVGYPYA